MPRDRHPQAFFVVRPFIARPFLVRPFMAFLLLCLAALAVRAIEPPPMGAEIRIDHGFRYEVDRGWLERSAVSVADSVVLLANNSFTDYSITGFRRSLDGREVDIDQVPLAPQDHQVGPFDLSPFDGNGWKLVYLADQPGNWQSLFLRDLDRTTLAPIGPDLLLASGAAAVGIPSIAWSGERHIVTWSDGGTVWLARVRPDMTLEDGSPIAVGQGSGIVAVAADTLGGIVAWCSGQVHYRLLDGDGLPTGAQRGISLYASPIGVEVSRLSAADSTWIVTWCRYPGVFCAAVNGNGEIAPSGIGVLSSDWTIATVTVAGHADSACVAWQVTQDGPVSAAIVSPTSDGWSIRGIQIAPSFPLWGDGCFSGCDTRTIDCAWTGDRYAVLWCTQAAQITAVKGRSHSTSSPRDLLGESSTAFADFLTGRGDPIVPVFEVSVGSRPVSIGVSPSGPGYVATVWDAYGSGRGLGEDNESYIHTRLLDAAGNPSSPAQRYWTPAYSRTCDIFYCDWSYVMGYPYHRFAGTAPVLLYGFDAGWEDQYGAFEDTDALIADFLTPDGALDHRTTIVVDHTSAYYRLLADPAGFDIARGPDFYGLALATIKYANPDTARLEVDGLTFDGNVNSGGFLDSVNAHDPSIAAIGDRFLLLWLEGFSDPQLQATIFDPSGGAMTTSAPVSGSLTAEGLPFLVPGAGQVLAVFPGRVGSGDYDIYAMRFGMDGAPLDTLPIHIGTDPGKQGEVSGVWDGNQYVVTWSNLDAGQEAILGCRLSADGSAWDTTPWVIRDGVKGNVVLASSAYSQVLAAYGGNIVRTIDDDVALSLDDGPGGGIWPADVRIGPVFPNPGKGSVQLDIEIPARLGCVIEVFDAGGRRVHSSMTPRGTSVFGWRWDGLLAGGQPAPAGVYFLRVKAGGKETIRRALLIR